MEKTTRLQVIKYAVYAVTAIVIAVLLSTTCSNYRKYQREVNNREALMDSIHTLEASNGDLIQYRKAYELTSKEYSDYMNVTDKEIKDLERKLKSSIDEISVLKGSVRVDTLHCVDSVYITDNVTNIRFGYDDRWVSLSGNTQLVDSVASTTIDSISLPVSLKVGFTKDNNVFATSDNPYVKFTSIEGSRSEYNKPKRKSVGLQVGVGPMVGYNPINKNFAFTIGAYVGVGFGIGKTW